MKVVIILEDTTKGIYPEIRWRGNGCCDQPHESLSMHLATTFSQHFEELEKSGVIVMDRNQPNEAGA